MTLFSRRGHRWQLSILAPGILSALSALSSPTFGASIEPCVEAPQCNCIYYSPVPNAVYKEMRCGNGGGWVPTTYVGPPPDGDPGSWGGGTQLKPVQNPPPGADFTPGQVLALDAAKTKAETKVSPRWWKDPSDGVYIYRQTTCSALFLRNKLQMEGRNVLAATRFRRGQLQLMQGTTIRPCDNLGTFAWLDPNRGSNDRYVFVCDRALTDFPPQTVALFLIHESLHVAGQLEDQTTSNGPGNPPTSGQITDIVDDACDSPTMLPVD